MDSLINPVKKSPISGMYEDYFLDYASYVILERAIPHMNDGLKPVQRRLLFSMESMHDGRFHKVANIIGQTMQYHPHGDAAIGAALVNLGQKDLLIDTQGNWGDYRTGDSAAASRYIEARLTKFALDVAFNGDTTDWQLSYDGRKNEPITLPMKFPILLVQGVEGIAVGLSTKIMPHNYNEIINASINILKKKKVKIYPDFQTGGFIDVGDYKQGMRGGKIKVRAKIGQVNKNQINITELPYGVTTTTLIDSILKANDKGKIKIKKVTDNTAENVEILIDLASGVSPEMSIDALYAFTNCEISISPICCVIIENKPVFLPVNELLTRDTFATKELLRQELQIKKDLLEEKWHLASLEKIFIENRIYRDIEESETWEDVLETIKIGLAKYVVGPQQTREVENRKILWREIIEQDIIRLTEIRIKRISKYNKFKADERIDKLLEELDQVNYDLEHLTDFAINYFEELLKKYGAGKERKTQITNFETITASNVVANNAKLYVDRKEGFIGYGNRKDEYVCDCSDIDDVIIFRKDGKFMVTRISDKSFVGKNIIDIGIWQKDNKRRTYNIAYLDGKSGNSYIKRFNVTAITRDKEYDMTTGEKGSKLLYFTNNPNGESEVIHIQLSAGSTARKKSFEYNYADLEIKGRATKGNILTKYPVKKITHIRTGKSTLGAMKVWIDNVSGRINKDGRGDFLGEFDTGDKVLSIYKNGFYELRDVVFEDKLPVDQIKNVFKHKPSDIINIVYFEGEKKWTMVKRFMIETQKNNSLFQFISDHRNSKLYFAMPNVYGIEYVSKVDKQRIKDKIIFDEFIDVKGWKAIGNKLGEFKIKSISVIVNPINKDIDNNNKQNERYNPGDTLELF